MRRLVSLAWLRVEKLPMIMFDLLPGVLLVTGGMVVILMGVAGLASF